MSSPEKRSMIVRKARRAKSCSLTGTIARHDSSADFIGMSLCALDFLRYF